MKLICNTIEEFIINAKKYDQEFQNLFFKDNNLYQELIEYCKENGNNDSDFFLIIGHCYRFKKGVKGNYKEAFKWYTKSAENGNALAQFYLGQMYRSGKLGEPDYEKVLYWYTKAAEQWHIRATFQVMFSYRIGRGVEQNDELADYW